MAPQDILNHNSGPEGYDLFAQNEVKEQGSNWVCGELQELEEMVRK